jgi:hypothetical protein
MPVVSRFSKVPEDPLGIQKAPGRLMLACLLESRLKISW